MVYHRESTNKYEMIHTENNLELKAINIQSKNVSHRLLITWFFLQNSKIILAYFLENV